MSSQQVLVRTHVDSRPHSPAAQLHTGSKPHMKTDRGSAAEPASRAPLPPRTHSPDLRHIARVSVESCGDQQMSRVRRRLANVTCLLRLMRS